MTRPTLSSWSIRNPIPPIVLFLVLTLAGLYSFKTMPVNSMPQMSVPVVTVSISQPGAGPEEMESRITTRVERAVSGLQNVKHISSDITTGLSMTTVEFRDGMNDLTALIDVKSAVDDIRAYLTADIEEPLIRKLDVEGEVAAVYAVIAPEEGEVRLSHYIDNELASDLGSLPGVARVERMGGLEWEISVNLNPNAMAAYGVSAQDISRQAARMFENAPGGRLIINKTEYPMRTLAGSAQIEDLRQLSLPLSNGGHLRLGDIAEISENGAEPRTKSRLDGWPTICFAIFRSKGASEVEVVRTVDVRLAELSSAKGGISFKKIISLAQFSEQTYKSAIRTFFEGILLTVGIMFLFLRDGRSTLIAALTIPLSIIPTFAAMNILGFTINTISLLGLSLVVGVLVDDAIVEIENIHRHLDRGQEPYQASLTAADEIGLAVVATTAVICAVFAPVSFMPGLSGQIFRQFGLTVAMAAFFSLLAARLIVPMLCAHLLRKPPTTAPHGQRFLAPLYHKLVKWTLRHRKMTLGLAVSVLVGSFLLLPLIPQGFVPQDDYSLSVMKLELPQGSTLEQTDQAALAVMRELKKRPEVDFVLSTVNGGLSTLEGVHQAHLEIGLISSQARTLSQKDFEVAVLPELKHIADVKVSFVRLGGGQDISLALSGHDYALMVEYAGRIEKEMLGLKGLSAIGNSAAQIRPEIVVRPKAALAAHLGVTTEQISQILTSSTIGDNEAMLPYLTSESERVPVRMRLPHGSFTDLGILRNLTVINSRGEPVPLSAVADFSIEYGPGSLKRYDQKRNISLVANLSGLALGDALERIYNLDSVKNLPSGLSLNQTGDAEMMAETNHNFILAICTGLLLVYVVQVLLYKDWIQPISRMAALPLSICGAFLLLLATNTELGLPAIIGMLTLIGIADKNSILLVDYILERIRAGCSKNEAILEGCRVRARPIIMTSLAMAAGMLPIVLGLDQDSAFRAPMAIAVIGGVISSTLLSLVFVPVLFSYIRDFETWIFPKLRKIIR